MRESPVFEVRLHRFGVWHSAVSAVAAAAVTASLAWAFATVTANGEIGTASVAAIAVALIAATLLVAVALLRVPAGVLSCRDGVWSFAADAGARHSGTLSVAIDAGSYLLLRLRAGPFRSVWLPVQRRGLEHDWHALRCAVYWPRPADGATTATSSPSE
ncbi:MAG: hypothetical protein ACXWUL_02400 [Caldimonas sp.]